MGTLTPDTSSEPTLTSTVLAAGLPVQGGTGDVLLIACPELRPWANWLRRTLGTPVVSAQAPFGLVPPFDPQGLDAVDLAARLASGRFRHVVVIGHAGCHGASGDPAATVRDQVARLMAYPIFREAHPVPAPRIHAAIVADDRLSRRLDLATNTFHAI